MVLITTTVATFLTLSLMIRKTFGSAQNVEYLHRVACEAHESTPKLHFTLIKQRPAGFNLKAKRIT